MLNYIILRDDFQSEIYGRKSKTPSDRKHNALQGFLAFFPGCSFKEDLKRGFKLFFLFSILTSTKGVDSIFSSFYVGWLVCQYDYEKNLLDDINKTWWEDERQTKEEPF